MAEFVDNLPDEAKLVADKAKIKSADQAILTPTAHLLLQESSPHDIYVLKASAAKVVAKESIKVSDLLDLPYCMKWARLSFGCEALDKCTQGGIVTRGITEICGVAGSGKTQLLLQLSLMSQLPLEFGGLGAGVAFICTEHAFPSKRLHELSKTFTQKYPSININYLAQVHVQQIHNSEQLLKCCAEHLPPLMASERIRLIIIDSVAAVFRTYSDFIQRARDMRKLANCLLNLGDRYNCAVICVNQVTSISKKQSEIPCLGLAWSHLGRTRLRISKVPKQIKYDDKLLTVRKLEIIYSPETPIAYAEFLITGEGIVNVP
ncbi:DNA repair protein XRCC3-like [Musca domestica]|uniref:DNA repair protein XRCC3-like n=1 Tax=Musca domestica TaxID=7370 RepID=A0ABM3VDS7_MUSDO|nr:DNA repair protein XRCC3-like [Musca domestica]